MLISLPPSNLLELNFESLSNRKTCNKGILSYNIFFYRLHDIPWNISRGKSLFSSIDLTIRNWTFPSMKYIQDQQLVILAFPLEVILSHTDKALFKLLNKWIPSKPMSYIQLFFFRVYKLFHKESVTKSQTMYMCVSRIMQYQRLLIDLVILSCIHQNKNLNLHSSGMTINSSMKLWFID